MAGFDIYQTWLIVCIVFAVLITFINIKGVKAAAMLQKIPTITIAAVGIILVVIAAINSEPSNLNDQMFIGENGGAIAKNILSVAMVAPFFLFGFDVIPQAAEEINVPLKKLGKLLIFSIALAVAFYGLVVLVVGYGMDAEEVASSVSGSGLVTADAMAKLFNSTGWLRSLS